MKVKLKEGMKLESHGSHQGLPVKIWSKLNNGKTVTLDSIPEKAKDKLEEVSTAASKQTIKTSSKKGGK